MGRMAKISVIHKDVLEEIKTIKESPSKFLHLSDLLDYIIQNNTYEIASMGKLSKNKDDCWYTKIRDNITPILEDVGGSFYHYLISKENIKDIRDYLHKESTDYNDYLIKQLGDVKNVTADGRIILTIE